MRLYLAVPLLACTPAVKTRFANEGKVCIAIDTKAAPADFEGGLFAGIPLVVTVHAPQNMPAGACLQAVSHCTARVDGATLQIESQLRFDVEGKHDCIATSTAAVVCDGPPLEEGHYALQHGSARGAFDVPSASPFCDPQPAIP